MRERGLCVLGGAAQCNPFWELGKRQRKVGSGGIKHLLALRARKLVQKNRPRRPFGRRGRRGFRQSQLSEAGDQLASGQQPLCSCQSRGWLIGAFHSRPGPFVSCLLIKLSVSRKEASTIQVAGEGEGEGDGQGRTQGAKGEGEGRW